MAEQRVSSSTVLIAIDGSDNAYYAVKWYIDNLYRQGHEVIFVNVIPYLLPDSAAVGRGPGYEISPEVIADMRQEMLKEFKPVEDKVLEIIQDCPIKSKFHYMDGDAGHVLCKMAKERKIAMIIMGSRGLTKMRRTILGSVSEYVLHHAHCPVTICKNT